MLGQEELQAAVFQGLLQQAAGGDVELALEQPVADVHHGHVHAAQLEAVGRFQTEQAAADDHRMFMGLGGVHHHLGVGDIAVTDHPGQVLAGNRQDKRVGTGGDEQAIVFGFAAVIGHYHAGLAVDLHHFAPEQQLDAVLRIPVEVVEHDFLEGLFAGQYRGEQDTVVVRVRLGAKYADVVQVRGELDQLFKGTDSGHAVTDHYQLEFFHGSSPSRITGKQKRRPASHLARTPLSKSRSLGKCGLHR
ncbi:hypothetical protein D3C85_737430 [compost metagenome]